MASEENNVRIEKFNRAVDERLSKVMPEYLQKSGFSSRKLTDTPTDAFQVVSRKYVNLNGTSANRPTSSIVGQFYFDTTLGFPIWWDGVSFVDAQGNVV